MNFNAPNLKMAWQNWFAQFKIFLRASNLEAECDQRKVALLLHHMGPDAMVIFNSYNLDVDKTSYKTLVEQFKAHFVTQVNIITEHHKYFPENSSMRNLQMIMLPH